jgi:hypothetical protein
MVVGPMIAGKEEPKPKQNIIQYIYQYEHFKTINQIYD